LNPILGRPAHIATLTSMGLRRCRRSRKSGAQRTGWAFVRSGGFVVPVVRNSPAESGVGGLRRDSRGVQRCLSWVSPLVAQPVVLRVVRVIERVKEGLETSDGSLLRQVLCGHTGTLSHAELGHERSRAVSSRRLTDPSRSGLQVRRSPGALPASRPIRWICQRAAHR
jgi:hypothetical protein